MFEEFNQELEIFGGPPILWFGDSHLNHLKTYITSKDTEAKYKLAFNQSYFTAVGGTTWSDVINHVKGINLKPLQKHRGDQWSKLKQSIEKGNKFLYCCISLGGNDVDSFHNEIMEKLNITPKKKMHWLEAKVELDVAFKKISDKINCVLDFLTTELDDITLCYIKIAPRPWWGHMARTLARWLDYHVLVKVKPKHKIKQLWVRELFAGQYYLNEQIMPGMLCTDIVHYNSNGNKAFIYGTMKSLLQMWRERYPHKPRRGGVPRYVKHL